MVKMGKESDPLRRKDAKKVVFSRGLYELSRFPSSRFNMLSVTTIEIALGFMLWYSRSAVKLL